MKVVPLEGAAKTKAWVRSKRSKEILSLFSWHQKGLDAEFGRSDHCKRKRAGEEELSSNKRRRICSSALAG